MLSKRSLPVVFFLVITGFLIAFNSSGLNNPPDKFQLIFKQVTEMLEYAHYDPKKIDDEFSKNIFKKYIESLDPDKNIFLASDIKDLSKYETLIDNELHGDSFGFFYATENIFKKRITEVNALYPDLLKSPFQFNSDETVVLDSDKLDYPKNENARKEAWRKRLKYLTLERYADKLDQRSQLKKGDSAYKSDEILETQSRNKVKEIITRNFDRLINKVKPDDHFEILVNVITNTMDPHTTFFPPIEKRSFDEQMSGRFYGIGASLRNDEGAIRIATIVAGLPAWKSQQFAVGDQVLKVAQGASEPVDLAGFEVQEAVKLIRGKKGTEVRLSIKKADGTVKIISMIRDEVVLDETYAKSAIVKEGDKNIGYIFLPEFYADWERPNGAKSAHDIGVEINKLKQQKVDGIVMDLRYNGGGSLYDVVQIAGYFIPEGPIVQVKDKEGVPSVLRDRDRSVMYEGPLAIMVNEFSASASEIFAAAMQDYDRGVVVGSTSTYGKGTVQRNIELRPETGLMANNESVELGTIKLTLQKFYRINGGSTQLKGVAPQIILPDQYESLKYREKDNPDAMPWDEIAKASYVKSQSTYDIEMLKQNSSKRVQENASFNAINEIGKLIEKSNAKVYSLNLTKYKQEQTILRDGFKKIEEVNKSQKALTVSMLSEDEKKLSVDQDKLERRKQWITNLSKDLYLSETCKIVSDMIGRNMVVTNK